MEKDKIKQLLEPFEGVLDRAPLNRMEAHLIQSQKYSDAGDHFRAQQFHDHAFKELEAYRGTEFDKLVDEAKLDELILR